ncbi:hypothetical protein BC831DRAFT_470910 [Entophlyctis helioformis]|nr:hypothetical protein BC831DRAFT_470910 [Entophlyctis helioformis]
MSDTKVDTDALKWINEMSAIEASRLREVGVKPVIMQPSNCGIIRQDESFPPTTVNRIEIRTNFDFASKIKQIMVSAPRTYPNKLNFLYVNVLLMTEHIEMPLLVPYLYQGSLDKRKKDVPHNNLKEWLIVNASGARARFTANLSSTI